MDKNNFQNLRSQLMETKNWPLRYMFKFITPNNHGKVDQVKALLPADGELSFKHTSSLKYVSITCVASMASADGIIDVMEQVSKTEGVIVL